MDARSLIISSSRWGVNDAVVVDRDLVAELVVLLLWVRYQVTLVVLQVDALTYSS